VWGILVYGIASSFSPIILALNKTFLFSTLRVTYFYWCVGLEMLWLEDKDNLLYMSQISFSHGYIFAFCISIMSLRQNVISQTGIKRLLGIITSYYSIDISPICCIIFVE
jgi:hypothetical protein